MLVKFMDNPTNVSHSVTISYMWMYDANYLKSLLLVK